MFKLYFATPDKKVISDADLQEITVPAYRGELNILEGHAPLMTNLEAGILRYKLKSGESAVMAISWGYCQISLDGVTILAETAVHKEDIDATVIDQHLKEFEEKLGSEALDPIEFQNIQHEIARLRAEQDLFNEKRH